MGKTRNIEIIEIDEIPKLRRGKKPIIIGHIEEIHYRTADGQRYKHTFEEPEPYLLTDEKNFFIVTNRRDVKFKKNMPNMGIQN